MTDRFLIDTSAFARWAKPAVRARVRPLHETGVLALCGPVAVEITRMARSKSEAMSIREELRGFDWLYAPDEVWDRVLEIQAALVGRGSWRTLSVTDLTVAAVAEMNGVAVLHYDRDYDRIAEVTGQATEWVVAPGSAD
ncbi:PIN domain nuclease [Streptomyces boninensis]|uniref:PIN domain nuclease n=1 Tax=Streptomyces boninensis TaxID=2039455 RepID=UPI003B219212